MKYFCDIRGWKENPKWVISICNHLWNINLWVYEEPGKPYGKAYSLTFFIPHFIKKWLVAKYYKNTLS